MRFRRRRGAAAERYGAEGRPATRLGWREAEWLAVDLELTGLDPGVDHIISVGTVPVSGGRVQLAGARYSLVATPRRSAPAAVLRHRLLSSQLEDAPPLSEVLELLVDELAGRVPIFHHAAVETVFLSRHLRRRGIRMPPAADTEALGREWLARRSGAAPASIGLGDLVRRLGHEPEPAHHALADALTTAQAFVALATLLEGGGRQTVGALLSGSVRTVAGSGRAPTG